MASTQTLKRSNKKCEKDEVFELANNSIEKEISRETFESFIPVNTKTIYETKCTWKKNLLVTAKKNPS